MCLWVSAASAMSPCSPLLLLFLSLLVPRHCERIYHNQFAVHVPAGAAAADEVSRKLGLVNLGQIGALRNYFLLENKRISKR